MQWTPPCPDPVSCRIDFSYPERRKADAGRLFKRNTLPGINPGNPFQGLYAAITRQCGSHELAKFPSLDPLRCIKEAADILDHAEGILNLAMHHQDAVSGGGLECIVYPLTLPVSDRTERIPGDNHTQQRDQGKGNITLPPGIRPGGD